MRAEQLVTIHTSVASSALRVAVVAAVGHAQAMPEARARLCGRHKPISKRTLPAPYPPFAKTKIIVRLSHHSFKSTGDHSDQLWLHWHWLRVASDPTSSRSIQLSLGWSLNPEQALTRTFGSGVLRSPTLPASGEHRRRGGTLRMKGKLMKAEKSVLRRGFKARGK